jgi:NAD(P)-dependent dehydrogenase (short-subunit alcohol dehydrogenase family)
MIDKKFGRIFNVGSWADVSPIGNSAAYAASKGALHALTKSIAIDIDHYQADIEVHEWLPGHLNTQMSEFSGMHPAAAASWAAKIAARSNATNRSCIYERDREWQPPESIKEKIKSRIMFWRR